MQGTLTYKNIRFTYVLDQKKLTLKYNTHYYESFLEEFYKSNGEGMYTPKDNYFNIDYLIGKDDINNYTYIFFLESKKITINWFTNIICCTINGYAKMDYESEIGGIQLYCKELNGIYNIKRAINKSEFDEKDGSAEVILKPTTELETEEKSFVVDNQTIKYRYCISRTLCGKNLEYPIKMRSFISFKFDSTNDYDLIVKIFNVAKKYIQFLCFRKNISIEEVTINKKQNDKYYKIGNFEWMGDEKIEEEKRIIEERYIPYELIKDNEEKILQSIYDRNLYMRHIPLSNEKSREDNEASFVMQTAAFEWEFKKLFPNGRPQVKTDIEIENKVRNNLNSIIEKAHGKEKKIYKNLRKFVTINNLAEDIKYSCKELEEIVLPIGNKLYEINREKLIYNDMSNRLSEQRNSFAHGKLDKEFIGKSLLDLIFLKYMVYAMQLKRFGVSNENIKKAIINLFNAAI